MQSLLKTLCTVVLVPAGIVLSSSTAHAENSGIEVLSSGGYFRLKTMFRGDGECLEGNQAGSPVHAGSAFMDACQGVSGQLWTAVPEGDYFRLKTMFRGDGECLEGNQADSPVHSGNAFMDACQDVSGQLWTAVPVESAGPPMLGQWTFESGEERVDKTGNWGELMLVGDDANIWNGELHVTGGIAAWAYARGYQGPTIREKTLVSWVSINLPDVGSGSVLTIDGINEDNFDGIIYAERQPRRWMAGSSFFLRTQDAVTVDETAGNEELLQLAISYKDLGNDQVEVTLCRNGTQIGQYTSGNMTQWEAGDAEVIFGKRHTPSGLDGPGEVDARIAEARIYGGSMTCQEVAALE